MARPRPTLKLTVFIICCSNFTFATDATPVVSFASTLGRVDVQIDDRPIATYVYNDDQITRPYFCNVTAPCGKIVTRPLPPGPNDLADHPQMHPGLWLAFGDLNDQDDWRLKAPVRHVEFVDEPQASEGRGTFAVRNRYLTEDEGRTFCDEVCRYTITAAPSATTIQWDSTFTPVGDEPLVFGDQEEMGLGVRLASVIAEKQGQGGLLTNSNAQTTAASVWGQPAAWCDYSGDVDGESVGITVAGHPENFRPCWWHARDYGFMAANPFGRQAMQQGEPSRVVVEPGDTLRLRFVVVVHDGRPGEGYDPATATVWSESQE